MEKTIKLGKAEGSKKKGRPNMKRINSVTDTTGMSPQRLSGAAEDRELQTPLVHNAARGWS